MQYLRRVTNISRILNNCQRCICLGQLDGLERTVLQGAPPGE